VQPAKLCLKRINRFFSESKLVLIAGDIGSCVVNATAASDGYKLPATMLQSMLHSGAGGVAMPDAGGSIRVR
jgi:hypothetical protein